MKQRFLSDMNIDELKNDYKEIMRMEKEQDTIMEKYENAYKLFGTIYGVKQAILAEIGKREISK